MWAYEKKKTAGLCPLIGINRTWYFNLWLSKSLYILNCNLFNHKFNRFPFCHLLHG